MEQEQSRVDAQRPARVPREIIIVVIFALALVLGVAGVIIYGYRVKAAWVGVSGKTVWDYLDLLFVPAVLAIGATVGASWFNLEQSKRQTAAEKEQAKAAEDAETQRAQSDALQAYITEVGNLITEYIELSTEQPELQSDITDAESKHAEAEREYAEAEREYAAKLIDLERTQNEYEEEIKYMLEQPPAPGAPGYGKRWVNPKYYRELIEDRAREVENYRRRSEGGARQAEILRRELASVKQRARGSENRYTVRRSVIRAQTLTALERVGEQHKRAIMRLLSEAEVVQVEVGTDEERIIQLRDADFSGADLTYMHLAQNSLQSIRFTKANLAGTNLTNANLSNADLTDADLSNANLTNARVTQDQLAKCKSLSGVTMPNGSKHP
jgi:hypothetical protein